MEFQVERLAMVHPGAVHHVMDHYVMDITTSDGAVSTYLSVYSIAFMPEAGAGHVAFLRIRDASGALNCDYVIAESVELGFRMQQRLRRILRTSDISMGIGPNLEVEPIVGSFQRQPWDDDGPAYVVSTDSIVIAAKWLQAGTTQWVAAPRGSLHHERDIVGTMIPFWNVELTVDGAPIPGVPYEDPWWVRRLEVPFSSTHVSLGDTALEPGGHWWASQGGQ